MLELQKASATLPGTAEMSEEPDRGPRMPLLRSPKVPIEL